MIRFQATSSLINSNTFWTDGRYTGSFIGLNLTSSFSGEKTLVLADVVSAKYNGQGSWILFKTSGSLLPTSSGQYDLNVYGAASTDAKWGNIKTQFGSEDQTWGTVQSNTVSNQFLTEDRVYISGSDYDTITNYNYQDNPVYQVYNG